MLSFPGPKPKHPPLDGTEFALAISTYEVALFGNSSPFFLQYQVNVRRLCVRRLAIGSIDRDPSRTMNSLFLTKACFPVIFTLRGGVTILKNPKSWLMAPGTASICTLHRTYTSLASLNSAVLRNSICFDFVDIFWEIEIMGDNCSSPLLSDALSQEIKNLFWRLHWNLTVLSSLKNLFDRYTTVGDKANLLSPLIVTIGGGQSQLPVDNKKFLIF